MTQRQFYDWQTLGGGKDVSRLVGALEERGISWCMIGGLAVNHWAEEPMATADVDLVIAVEAHEEALDAFKSLNFSEKRFEWSINLKGTSKVSIQVSTEAMYRDFPSRGICTEVHGILMRVASLEDTLAGKLAAFASTERRPSKKLKDLTDIARLLEAHPTLASKIPADVAEKITF